jgi:hypothetical protein
VAYHIQHDLIRLLKREMRDKQATQTRLAGDVGISRKHLYQVLAGKAQASVDLWQRLLDAVAGYQGVSMANGDGGGSGVRGVDGGDELQREGDDEADP